MTHSLLLDLVWYYQPLLSKMPRSKKMYPTAFKLNGRLIKTSKDLPKEEILNWIARFEEAVAKEDTWEEKEKVLHLYSHMFRKDAPIVEAMKAKGYYRILDVNKTWEEVFHNLRNT